jgi:branched-subunit amino acid ABC-type transport system permease component
MTLDILIQIVASGLTLGAMYAVSTVGLSLVWGSLGMLNMAHGGLMAFGGYAAFYAMNGLGRCCRRCWRRSWWGRRWALPSTTARCA